MRNYYTTTAREILVYWYLNRFTHYLQCPYCLSQFKSHRLFFTLHFDLVKMTIIFRQLYSIFLPIEAK